MSDSTTEKTAPEGVDCSEELYSFRKIRNDFFSLKKKWKDKTSHLSDPKEKAIHPAYQKIIGLGFPVVPFIIEDLRRGPDHWFWALNTITGEDPIPDEHYGRMEVMAHDWIEWWEDFKQAKFS